MSRWIGEVIAACLAAFVTFAVLTPAVTVAVAGGRLSPGDNAVVVTAMVYAMAAPIGFFLAETWWARIVAVLSGAGLAGGVGFAAYGFETHRPLWGVAAVCGLICSVLVLVWVGGLWRRRQDLRMRRIETQVQAVVAGICQNMRLQARGNADAEQTVLLVERVILASVWGALHDATPHEGVWRKIDQVLVELQTDLTDSRAMAVPVLAGRVVAEIRSALRLCRQGHSATSAAARIQTSTLVSQPQSA